MSLANYGLLTVKEQRDIKMTRLIERNSTIPTRTTRSFAASSSCVSIQLLEGESPLARDNHPLGELQLDNLSSAGAIVEVTLDIDPNGILHLSAKAADHSRALVVTHDDHPRWSATEIERSVAEAELGRSGIGSFASPF